MSAVPVRLAPSPVRAARSATPRPAAPRAALQLVAPARGEGRRVPYLALLAAILFVALLSTLVLNTSMATTSYTIRDRTIELTNAQQRLEALATQVDQASAPAEVMRRAQGQGLVPSPSVVYIRLSDASLIGGN